MYYTYAFLFTDVNPLLLIKNGILCVPNMLHLYGLVYGCDPIVNSKIHIKIVFPFIPHVSHLYEHACCCLSAV